MNFNNLWNVWCWFAGGYMLGRITYEVISFLVKIKRLKE